MKIPKHLTKQQTIDIIQKVVDKVSHKYVFGYYDLDDIKQEAFLLGIDGLERYDGTSPLENFLSVHISNRLKTFLRDNYYRKINVDGCQTCQDLGKTCDRCERRLKINERKINLMNPIDINSVRMEDGDESGMYDDFDFTDVETQELLSIIRERLPIDMTEDYLRMRHGTYVTKPRREEIKAKIIEILESVDAI